MIEKEKDKENTKEIRKQQAELFKAFSDENRIYILSLLQTGEKCACTLLENLQISQSTLSHHMKILCETKIVIPRKEGKWTYYSINQAKTSQAKAILEQITTVSCNTKACTCKET